MTLHARGRSCGSVAPNEKGQRISLHLRVDSIANPFQLTYKQAWMQQAWQKKKNSTEWW